MKVFLLIFIISLNASASSGGKKDINYQKEISKTQENTDLDIIKRMHYIRNNEELDYDHLLRVSIDEYAGFVSESYSRTYLSANYRSLYGQFIYYRHSSKELNEAIFDHQTELFSQYLNSIAEAFKLEKTDFKLNDRPLRVDSARKYLELLFKVSEKIHYYQFEESSFPVQLWPEINEKYDLKNHKKELYGFCKLNYLGHNDVCRSFFGILKSLEFRKNQRYNTGLLTKANYLNILTKKEIILPVLNTAIDLLKMRFELDSKTPEGSVFSILVQNFIEAGFSEQKARMTSMKIMGLYGQRGASFSMTVNNWMTRFFKADNQHMTLKINSLNLALIFSAISVIDKYTLEKEGRHYSLPEGVTSKFLIGKPYYFWMSAMLAYDYSQENPDMGYRPIVKAIQLFNQAYQFRSWGASFNGRDPRILDNKYYNHSIKMDMIVGLAGSLWALKPQSYSLDKVLAKLFTKSEDISKNQKDHVAKKSAKITDFLIYNHKWKQVFEPQVAIKELFKQVNKNNSNY